MDKGYRSIVEHYECCLEQHGDSHLGVDWPNQADADRRYRVMLDLVRSPGVPATMLDFGCGLSHMYQYMIDHGIHDLAYSGLDLSEAFCNASREKYPQNAYHCIDVLTTPDLLGEFDYITMNGVFTEKRDLSFSDMFEYFKNVLRIVFPKARNGIAFNVMSKAVDWERDDLFHLSTDMLIDFMTRELSRHFIIRNDYGLYEYTVYLYKESADG